MDALVWAMTGLMVDQPDNWGVMEYYRREAEKAVAADPSLFTVYPSAIATLPASRAMMQPPKRAAATQLKAPAGISTAYGLTGRCYSVDGDGRITVEPDDAAPLRAAGFVDA